MYCAVCGTNNDDSALHCIQCGAKLGAADAPPPVAVVPVPAAPVTPSAAAAAPNYMVQSILMTVCCCLPIGIACIIKASKVDKLLALHDYDAARVASAENKKLLYIGLGLGIAAAVIYMIVEIIAIVASRNGS